MRARATRMLRRTAIVALPAALMIEPIVALGLALLVGMAPHDRRASPEGGPSAASRGWVAPVAGVLVAGLLAALAAVRSGAGMTPLWTWIGWTGAAVGMLILTARLDPDDAPGISVGSAIAAFSGLAASLRQVIWLGDAQAHAFAFHPNLAAASFLVAAAGVLVGWRAAWSRGGAPVRMALVLAIAAALFGVVLTGSRSGIVGLVLGGFAGSLLALPRARPMLLLRVAVGVVLAAALVAIVDRSLAGGTTPNRIVNSGFEYGTAAWTTYDATRRIPTTEGAALLLERSVASSWRLAGYAPRISVEPGAAFTFGVTVRPVPREGDRPTVTVAIDAFGEGGAVVARLGIDGWTADGLNDVGGRPTLPLDAVDDGSRFGFVVPPAPEATTAIGLEFQTAGSGTGAYGWIDDVSLVPGAVPAGLPYVAGSRPGLRDLVAPAGRRLGALADPASADGGRMAMWLVGLDVASARPILGYGPGTEATVARTYASRAIRRSLLHFHSFYLRLLIEGGAVLLATVSYVIARLLATFVRAALARRPGGIAACSLLVALLAQSAFDPVLNFAGVVGGLWLVASVGGAARS